MLILYMYLLHTNRRLVFNKIIWGMKGGDGKSDGGGRGSKKS